LGGSRSYSRPHEATLEETGPEAEALLTLLCRWQSPPVQFGLIPANWITFHVLRIFPSRCVNYTSQLATVQTLLLAPAGFPVGVGLPLSLTLAAFDGLSGHVAGIEMELSRLLLTGLLLVWILVDFICHGMLLCCGCV
jgi:hypothetical protein